jgi:serine protease Do
MKIMMHKRSILFLLFLLFLTAGVFGQTSALRDYVGMISQTFHPDVITFLEKLKADLEKRGRSNTARNLEAYIKGDSGTGFLYVASDGTNYILTNYHVISQALSLTITFEKQDGEKTVFSDLSIVAADEEMDIALLKFAGGQNPFKNGLQFYTKTPQEGDDVYSAGFPGLGTTMIWQLGRGMISNASVRLPTEDGTERVLGPFIQHTAQVDPGNSGGPLLIQTAGVPSGYAVVGINTLKAHFRQAANYSIPVSRIQSFLNASLNKGEVDQRALLDARLDSFMDGLKLNKAVYTFIASYLSHDCTGENAEHALTELLSKGSRSVQDDIFNAFNNSPVEGMNLAVGWLIENRIRTSTGSINIVTESITPKDDSYEVIFKINGKSVTTEWVNEYDIWRIYKFGDLTSGYKRPTRKESGEDKRLRTGSDFSFQVAAGPVLLAEPNDMLGKGNLALGLDSQWRVGYYGIGTRFFIRENSSDNFHSYFHLELQSGIYIPVKLNEKVAFIPYATLGVGFELKDKIDLSNTSDEEKEKKDFDIGLTFRIGMQFTAASVPGLFLFADYQYNLFLSGANDKLMNVPHAVFVGLGYTFSSR